MRPDAMLMHYQGDKPAELTGDTWVMDTFAPGWREMAIRNLKIPGSNLEPAGRAERIIQARPAIDIVVALGRDVAVALGLRPDVKWFDVYRRTIKGREVMLIPVPQPSRVNRLWNDGDIQTQMTDLFSQRLV